MTQALQRAASALNLPMNVVNYLAEALHEGASVPFLARYRRHQTENLSETQLTAAFRTITEFQAVEKRAERMLEELRKRDNLPNGLLEMLQAAPTVAELEALYKLYSQKQHTKAQRARELGYGPIAESLLHNESPLQLSAVAKENEEDFIYLIAEHIVHNPTISSSCRASYNDYGTLSAELSKKTSRTKTKEMTDAEFDNGQENVKNYDDFQKSFSHLKAYQILALLRGEEKGFLKLRFTGPLWWSSAFRRVTFEGFKGLELRKNQHNTSERLRSIIFSALDISEKKLIESCERLLRTKLRHSAENESVGIFRRNFRCLLMQRPLRTVKCLLAIDPGFSNGCKCVTLNASGDVVGTEKFFLHSGDEAERLILQVLSAYHVEKIVIGGGTASRETEDFLSKLLSDHKKFSSVEWCIVSEDGASAYSASENAVKEFGSSLDITFRGAVSIGRRVLDPLSELVKIPPQNIGVGMYQHDIPEKLLVNGLKEETQSVVSCIGININTASTFVLQSVPGITPSLAEKIVLKRQQSKIINSRDELLNVPGISAKVFEKISGFVRVPNSDEPLDNTNVHPESYIVVRKLGSMYKCPVETFSQLREIPKLLKVIDEKGTEDIHRISELASQMSVAKETLQQIFQALSTALVDPRDNLPYAGLFRKDLRNVASIRPGMTVDGRVVTVNSFGAFIDIGVGTSALLHKTELTSSLTSERRLVDHLEAIVPGQVLTCTILSIDRPQEGDIEEHRSKFGKKHRKIRIAVASSVPVEGMIPPQRAEKRSRDDQNKLEQPQRLHAKDNSKSR